MINAWCKRPGRPSRMRCGGSSRGAWQTGETEHEGMTAAPEKRDLLKLQCRKYSVCRTCYPYVMAEALQEETGKSNEGTPRGRGPVASVGIVEIMSGRSICQQGLAAICKDLAYRLRLKMSGGRWTGA